MPIYDFKCGECGSVSEVFLRDGDLGKARCPDCGSPKMEKLLSTFQTISRSGNPPGTTCCGREERCEVPPCSREGGCRQR